MSGLRVAFVVGGLAQGGAEKQLCYIVRALLRQGVSVRLYSLNRDEHHAAELRSMGIEPRWVGRCKHPLIRLFALTSQLLWFQPHVVHSSHPYTNIYTAILGRLFGAISLGVMRSSLAHSKAGNGIWTRWLVRLPSAIIVNSSAAMTEIENSQLRSAKDLFLLRNTIDTTEYDSPKFERHRNNSNRVRAIFVGRLVPVKRVDRFIQALSRASMVHPDISGLIVGSGPELEAAQDLAIECGLIPDRLTFTGPSSDVTGHLRHADMLVLCSDDEGSPNVILEAMAAHLPVITTAVGDAPSIVKDGVTGFVVDQDVDTIADRIIRLAASPELRHRLGESGRSEVELNYSDQRIVARLLSIYQTVAERQGRPKVTSLLSMARG